MVWVYYRHIRLGGTMYKKIISQEPLDGLITLTDVKSHCRVFNDFEDTYLSSLIPVYLDMAEGYTGRMFTTGSAVVVVHSWQSQVLLPYGNVTEVTKLVLDNTESTAFTFDDVSQIISINAPYATARIEFNAGYETLPVVVKQAVLVMINTAFNNRDDVVVGQSVNEMPRTSRDLLDRVKLPWQ
ncbi:head-tail adaptor [Aeromonas phage vB_AveS_KLEA5]|nr:head-tail adaptor [Aeromonas phage vB_AveS_KLEA5]